MNITIPHEPIYYSDPAPENLQAVLLIHGLGADHSSWIFQMNVLKRNYRPIAIDVPGFGKSTGKFQKWSLQECALSCLNLLEDLNIPSAHVIGISMGGVIAQYMALLNPVKVNKLILINTFARLRPQKLDEQYYLLKRYFLSRLKGKDYQAALVASRLFPGQNQEFYKTELIRQITQSDAHIYHAALKNLGIVDIRKKVMQIQNQTLVITAENDTTVAVKTQMELAGLIPGARQVFIPLSNHAVIVDQPDLVNDEIIKFLEMPVS
ncbi:MAG: alpha/beta hydrolase [Anaerolineae bacterium]|nr:alpha/beta hydrolase [Anaerolineae bacterium]